MWYLAVLAVSVLRADGLLFIETLEQAPQYPSAVIVELPEEKECAAEGFYDYHSLPMNASDVVVDTLEDDENPGLLALSCPCTCEPQECQGAPSCQFVLRLKLIPAVKRVIFKCHGCDAVEAVEVTGEARNHGVDPTARRYVVVEGTRLANITIKGPAPQANEVHYELESLGNNLQDCSNVGTKDEHPECYHLAADCSTGYWPNAVRGFEPKVSEACPFTCGVCVDSTSPTPTTGATTPSPWTTLPTTSPRPTSSAPATPRGPRIKVEQRPHPPDTSSWSEPISVKLPGAQSADACSEANLSSVGLVLDPERVLLNVWEEGRLLSGGTELALSSPCSCSGGDGGDGGVQALPCSYPGVGFGFKLFPPVWRVAFACRQCSNITVRDHGHPDASEMLHLSNASTAHVVIRAHRILNISIAGESPQIRDLVYELGGLEECRHPNNTFELCDDLNWQGNETADESILEERCNSPYDSTEFQMSNWELCPVTCSRCLVNSTTTFWNTTTTFTSTTTTTETATSFTTTLTTATSRTTTLSSVTVTSLTATTLTQTTRTQTATTTVFDTATISQAEEELLQELFAVFAENVTQVVTRSDVSTQTAKQITVPEEVEPRSYVPEVRVEGTSVAAAIPARLVQEAGGNVVVLMEAATAVDNDFVQNLTNSSDGTELAVPVVSVKLWAGALMEVRDLEEPILITMSDQSIANVECVFWNETEQQWSTSGLQTINDGNGLVCATTHLSIFSAILRQLECLNIQVLSAAGLEMASTSEWTDKPSAILLYGVTVFWLSLLVFAWRRDLLYLEETDWTDHNFIMKVPPSHRVPIGTDYCKNLCLSIFRLCSRRRAVVGMKWLRTADVGESLFLYVALLGVHSLLAVRSGLSPSTLRMHLINKRGWVQNDLATSSCFVLAGRLAALRSEVPQAFVSFFELSFIGCFWIFFQALHPYAVRLSLEQSAAKQIKLKADVMMGALVVAAFFFGVTGSATSSRSPEECADARMSMARFVLIGAISVSFVSVPISLLAHMWQRSFVDEQARGHGTREKQILFWQVQDFVFWVGSSIYTLFCCLFIALFIANLSDLDQWKWLLTFAVIVVRIAIVQPIGMAFLLAAVVRYVKIRRPELVQNGHPRLHFKLPKQAAHASLKVKELASRSVSVADLLLFWEKVPLSMPHFDANLATTHDVVRQAIIPLSKLQDRPEESSSYATLISEGNYRPPDFMVTHNWGNKFCHLISAILSEAIGEKTYETTATQLMQNRLSILHTEADKLHRRYWVCCFCVNQHASICDTPPARDSMGFPIYPCTCGVPKHWNGPLCEMDKFDEMIGYLSVVVPAFSQVVAVDMNFTAFTRIWCIAELAEARKMDLQQFLIVHSDGALQTNLHKIEKLDVRDAQASVPEDKDRVLEKIDDKDSFNESVRQLLLDRNVGLLTRFLFDLHGQAGPHDALDAMTHIMVDTMIPGVIE